MKEWLIVAVVFLCALLSGAKGGPRLTLKTHGTIIADTWQGTLHSGQDLRIVFKVSKTEDGYAAIFYSIEQGLELPCSKTTLDGSTVKMTLAMDRATYKGTLSADGKTITGEWSQGPSPHPLILNRATAETAWT